MIFYYPEKQDNNKSGLARFLKQNLSQIFNKVHENPYEIELTKKNKLNFRKFILSDLMFYLVYRRYQEKIHKVVNMT